MMLDGSRHSAVSRCLSPLSPPTTKIVPEILTDVQLLRGIATKLAVHEMLRDMALLPSQVHVHEWLAAYLLVEHKEDLTITGSVERLLCDLGSIPSYIRMSGV